ncbi:MAG: molybdopterin-dependent oxidoreductase [Deltaproteobacteria bacterium]|jgi:anaerobic selenocysteine-containing dehydrogenase|nr:molybdopterin-dependent oxidoreductase [Deltaproteobacteria bacterium]MBW2518343.1 molybdopterin-dependent oxidoreductase [Deltaproteobacteria bacterium]
MKVDRRSFLAFILGGAAGTALSPLPWKVTDDISIWSQNWPWIPVPPKGEISRVRSACTLCPGGCGISVKKVDERVIKIEGLEGHPINDGGLCPLGNSAAQLLYGPTRIQTPLKKVNGRWQKIAWQDAITELAAQLRQLRADGSAHTVGWVAGSDRGTVPELFNRFLNVYGSPNFWRMPSIWDSYELSIYLMQGTRSMAGFDIANADFVLSFGSGLIEGWGSPGYMFRAKSELREAGGRMDQIEPRLSKTAAKADHWISINPGTEGALALGLAHVIIKEQRYNRNFVNGYSTGLAERFQRVIDGFPPEIASKMTGISAGTILTLARDFAAARRPLAICGRGQGLLPGSLQTFLAVHTLNALVGNINQPGGVWAVPEPDYIQWPEPEIDAVAARGLQQPRIDGAGTDRYPNARYLLHRLPEVINASAESPLQVLFIADANPTYSLPDTAAVEKAFEKIPTVVSFSSYMDETSALADMVLPNHAFLERYQDVAGATGFPKPIISLAQPAVEPRYNTRHVGDVVIQLAKELGHTIGAAFEWDDYDSCLEETLGDRWDGLIENGYWVDEAFSGAQWADAFETDSAKFEFTNNDISTLAAYEPVKAEGDEAGYPLLLVPYDSMRLNGDGQPGAPPFMIKALEDTILQGNDVLVEINPASAKQLGLSEGRFATLATPKGSAQVKIRLTQGIMPGVIAIPRGLGHTADNRFLAGKGVNYNQLSGPIDDPASGHNAAWGIRAKLS